MPGALEAEVLEPLAQRGLVEDPADRLDERIRALGRKVDRGRTEDFGQGWARRGSHRRAAGHGFEGREAEPFVARGEDENRRRRIEQGERLAIHRRGQSRASVDAEPAGASGKRPALALVPADQEQAQRGVAAGELDESFEEQADVLVPLGIADEEQVRPVDAEGLRDERRGFTRRPRVEELLDAVRDDFDPGARTREPAQDLALGGVRDGDHARRGAHRAADHDLRVEARQPAELARRQVDDVVNGHHRRAGQANGQDVVRRVVEVEAQLARLRGKRSQFTEGVAAGALRHQGDPIARGEQFLVAGAVKEDPLDRTVEAHHAVHEVTHVRADAVVGRLAGVDADPQRGRLMGRREAPCSGG